MISPKPVSREFAREWQFNGLPTIRPSGSFPDGVLSDQIAGARSMSAMAISRQLATGCWFHQKDDSEKHLINPVPP
jgi:hypothetical protein